MNGTAQHQAARRVLQQGYQIGLAYQLVEGDFRRGPGGWQHVVQRGSGADIGRDTGQHFPHLQQCSRVVENHMERKGGCKTASVERVLGDGHRLPRWPVDQVGLAGPPVGGQGGPGHVGDVHGLLKELAEAFQQTEHERR